MVHQADDHDEGTIPKSSSASNQLTTTKSSKLHTMRNSNIESKLENKNYFIAKRSNVEIYGFVGWIVTFVILIMYFVYAFTPDSVLHAIGITYYPDKYWATGVPAFLCSVWMVLVFWSYLYIHYNSYPLDDMRCIEDNRTMYLKRENIVFGKSRLEHELVQKSGGNVLEEVLDKYPVVPVVRDVPLDIINELLFEQKSRKNV